MGKVISGALIIVKLGKPESRADRHGVNIISLEIKKTADVYHIKTPMSQKILR